MLQCCVRLSVICRRRLWHYCIVAKRCVLRF